MTATTPKNLSGRDACVAAIRAAGTPLSANAIATAVVESGVVATLVGKTPKATLGAQISSGAKKGTTFRQVGESKPKLYDVLDGVADSDPQVVQTLKGYFDRTPAGEPAAAEPTDEAPAAEPLDEAPAEPVKAKRSSKAAAKPDPKPTPTPRARRGRRGAAA